jgi:hypothetical protein
MAEEAPARFATIADIPALEKLELEQALARPTRFEAGKAVDFKTRVS